jgi:hypothetical protein
VDLQVIGKIGNAVILSSGAFCSWIEANISTRNEANCVTFQFDMLNVSLVADVRWIFRFLEADGNERNAVILSSGASVLG